MEAIQAADAHARAGAWYTSTFKARSLDTSATRPALATRSTKRSLRCLHRRIRSGKERRPQLGRVQAQQGMAPGHQQVGQDVASGGHSPSRPRSCPSGRWGVEDDEVVGAAAVDLAQELKMSCGRKLTSDVMPLRWWFCLPDRAPAAMSTLMTWRAPACMATTEKAQV